MIRFISLFFIIPLTRYSVLFIRAFSRAGSRFSLSCRAPSSRFLFLLFYYDVEIIHISNFTYFLCRSTLNTLFADLPSGVPSSSSKFKVQGSTARVHVRSHLTQSADRGVIQLPCATVQPPCRESIRSCVPCEMENNKLHKLGTNRCDMTSHSPSHQAPHHGRRGASSI